jgi:hypothetical protein
MASGSKLARRCVVVLTMAMVIAPGLAFAAQSAQTMQLNGPCPQYGVNRTYGGGWATMSVIRRGQRASSKALLRSTRSSSGSTTVSALLRPAAR